jgi:hypothetical protein
VLLLQSALGPPVRCAAAALWQQQRCGGDGRCLAPQWELPADQQPGHHPEGEEPPVQCCSGGSVKA